ncbi:MAG: HAD family hydrolase [Saprospiraceae bacterium]
MKYIIFDIDGTLTNTKKVDDKCFIKAFEKTFGINIENEKWEAIKHVTDWGITEEIFLREVGRKPYQAEYDLMLSNHVQLLKEEEQKDKTQFAEINGAKVFFEKLSCTKDIKLGIATGAWEQSANLKLEAIGIDTKDICFSNSDYHKTRENITKDVIRQLNQKTNQTPETIIYFGDGEWDFKTCNNLGIHFIGIDVDNNDKLKKLGATTIFNNFLKSEDILNVISCFADVKLKNENITFCLAKQSSHADFADSRRFTQIFH